MRRADHSSRGVLPTVLRRCVWSRNIKNGCSIYIYDISRLRVKVLNCGDTTRRRITFPYKRDVPSSSSWCHPSGAKKFVNISRTYGKSLHPTFGDGISWARLLDAEGLTLTLIHISAVLINGGCEPHRVLWRCTLGAPTCGFCLSVSWSFFSACFTSRDPFPPDGLNTSVRGRPHNRLVFGLLIRTITCSALLYRAAS